MPPVDDLSRTLGSIEASVAELTRQARALFERTDTNTVQLRAMEVTLGALTDTVSALKRDVADLRSARDRGLGLLIGLTLVSGSIGGVAAKLVGVLK